MKYDAYTARKVHAALVAAEKAAGDIHNLSPEKSKLWFQLMDARIDHQVYVMDELEEAK